ncbi:MAG: hypothetical protein ACJ745_11985 [Actinomycetes bacterium]
MACTKARFAAAVSAWPASPPRRAAMPLAAPDRVAGRVADGGD